MPADTRQSSTPKIGATRGARRGGDGRGRGICSGIRDAWAVLTTPFVRRPQQRSSPRSASTSRAPAGPGANPLSQGQMAAFVFRKAPEALPEVKFQDASGQGAHARRLARQGRAPQPVGDLVPALPQGDAGARPAAEGDWAPTNSRWWPSASTARGWQALAQVPRRDQGRAPCALRRRDRAPELGRCGRSACRPRCCSTRQGREIGRLLGPAEWDSEDAKRLIRSARIEVDDLCTVVE